MSATLTPEILLTHMAFKLPDAQYVLMPLTGDSPFERLQRSIPLFDGSKIPAYSANLLSASVMMFQALDTQCQFITLMIENREAAGNDEYVPTLTTLLQGADMARRAAIVGISELYTQYEAGSKKGQ